MARASLTGCPGGLSPRLSPRPSGGFLCPGCGVRSQTSRPSGCLVPEERQGCSLRTPQASPTQRTQRGVPRAPEPLQSGGGTRGRERSGPQGRGRGVGEGQAAPPPGDSGAPGAWGCQGPLASAPRLWRGGVSLILCPQSCPRHRKSAPRMKLALQRPAAHHRLLAVHALETPPRPWPIPWSFTLCVHGRRASPRDPLQERRQGVQRAPGLLRVEASLPCAHPPVPGAGSSSPRLCSSRRLPGRQRVPLSARAGSTPSARCLQSEHVPRSSQGFAVLTVPVEVFLRSPGPDHKHSSSWRVAEGGRPTQNH